MRIKSKINLAVIGALGFSLSPLMTTSAVAAESLAAALVDGQATMNIRYRYEAAEDSTNDDATASTVRARMGYTTGAYKGITGFLEFEDVSVVGIDDDYNSTQNGKTTYATIVDPEGTEVNQASLSYGGVDDTTIKLGRQRIILDNARFVGNVGWRQNEQTFDGLSVVNTSAADTAINYAYLTGVNGIKFDVADVEAHIINAKYTGMSAGELSVYGYFIDVDNSTTDTSTIGVRFKGSADVGMKLMYTVEIAQQGDYADAPTTVDADYMFVELGTDINGIKVKLANETLGGDGTYGFSTPLATKHAFNGWADKFLGISADGLNDMIFTVAGKFKGTKLKAVYHDFSADNGGAAYGSELDLLAVKKLSDSTMVGFKYADYSADTYSADTTKMWLWGQLKF